jgi:hypothetical protein
MSAFDSLFSDGIFVTAFGSPVTYGRGELEATVTAMDSLISTEARINVGASLAVDIREYVIAVSALTAFTEPARGDLITTSRGEVWEVARVGQLPEWELDADRNY